MSVTSFTVDHVVSAAFSQGKNPQFFNVIRQGTRHRRFYDSIASQSASVVNTNVVVATHNGSFGYVINTTPPRAYDEI